MPEKGRHRTGGLVQLDVRYRAMSRILRKALWLGRKYGEAYDALLRQEPHA